MLFRSRGQSVQSALRDFFGTSPLHLPIVSRRFSPIDLPNIQRGIESIVKRRDATKSEMGFTSPTSMFNSWGELLAEGALGGSSVGPVQYRDVEISHNEWLPCVDNGIFLIADGAVKLAVLVRNDHMSRKLAVEVVAATKEDALNFLREVSSAAGTENVYRGKVISLQPSSDGCGVSGINFHFLPQVKKEDIILPEHTIDVLLRNTVGFFEKSSVLIKAGRSAKRGLLIYGKPGTGKTLTARWLAQSVPGATVLLMSGDQLWLVRECCQIARMLAPSLVIMEDVDLIATARDEDRHPAYQVTLHQLLNEMDGIDTEAPVLFLMTTNRPGDIEPALASRPGRIDQAIEYPLPDAACRNRLIELYGKGLNLQVADLTDIIRRTEGASPAFIRELLRKALLFAAEDSDAESPPVRDQHVFSAMHELVFAGGDLTRNLLGFETTPND